MDNQDKIEKELKRLFKLLSLEYPHYNYKHVKVFASFWKLKDAIKNK